MEKQELLECLAPYLPYNLKAQVKIKGKQTIITVMYYHIWEYIKKPIDAKPILRPLTDLIIPCLEGGRVPIVEIFKELVTIPDNTETKCFIQGGIAQCRFEMISECSAIVYGIDVNNVDNSPWRVVKLLFKYHFDVEGLIEKGYAVDVNSVTKCTSK